MDHNVDGSAHLPYSRGGVRPLGAALALVAVVLGAVDFAAASTVQNDAVTESMLTARPHDIVLGPAQAPVTIVTYTEHHNNGYAAPWMNSLRPLRQKYGSSLRIIVRDHIMPGHEGAGLGASAAHGVFERRGEKAYLDFVEALASPQCLFVPRYLAAEAERVGAGPAPAFEAALDSDVWASRIGTNKADVQTAMIEAMPTAFINGQKFREVTRLDKIIPAIDAELTAARALEKQQGVHGAQLSLERTRVNLAAVTKLRAEDAATASRKASLRAAAARPALDGNTEPTEPTSGRTDTELAQVIEQASAKFCQQPDATTCQILTKFRQGQLPKLLTSEAISLGAMYRSNDPLPKLPLYLALRLRSQGASLQAASITLTPDNDTEQQETAAYIQSIRAGRRDPASTMHKLLQKELDTHSPSLKAERLKDGIFVSSPGGPGGFWIRQFKNEWIVLHLDINRGGFRIVPSLHLIVMPIE